MVAFVHGIETAAGAPLSGMDAPRIWTLYASVACPDKANVEA